MSKTLTTDTSNLTGEMFFNLAFSTKSNSLSGHASKKEHELNNDLLCAPVSIAHTIIPGVYMTLQQCKTSVTDMDF